MKISIKIVLLLATFTIVTIGIGSIQKTIIKKSANKYTLRADTNYLRNHVLALTETEDYRNSENPETLNQVAAYIFNELSKSCDTVFYQKYIADGVEYRNVIGQMYPDIEVEVSNKRIVIGAHYDVCGDQDGADDNASAVAGLLETARLCATSDTKERLLEFLWQMPRWK